MRKIKQIIIHCSVTKPSQNIGAADIKRWHIKDNGWNDIGYHYVIKRNGVLETGRALEQVGAHTFGHNKYSIGICLVGGLADDGKRTENNYTLEQWHTFAKLLTSLGTTFPEATVHGHNEFTNTKTCPCFDVQEWISFAGGE